MVWQLPRIAYQGAMHSLPIFLRLDGRPVILVGEGEPAEAKRRLLLRVGAVPVDEGADAALAIVALEDEDEAEAVIARLKARGILVNATDRPAQCDFTLPAIVERDPVLVAIGTGGASAGLAKTLRIALEGLLPPGLGGLATALGAARARLREHWPDPRARRLALDRAMQAGGPLDPLAAPDAGAVEHWLANPDETEEAQRVEILLRSDDPDDLTLREARLLGRADRVCHDADVPEALLIRARADAERRLCTADCGGCVAGLTVRLRRAR